MSKRHIPPALNCVLEQDKKMTKVLYEAFDRHYGHQKYHMYLKGLEVSCHGIPWLILIVAMLYLGYDRLLWMNMLALQLLDICLVAVVKAYTRRRRPVINRDQDMFLIVGVDKFSFPSGHASRAIAVALFFLFLYPLPLPLAFIIVMWSLAVAVSRVLLGRHHVLDVLGGLLLALVEFFIMKAIWMSSEKAESWTRFLSDGEDPWSSA